MRRRVRSTRKAKPSSGSTWGLSRTAAPASSPTGCRLWPAPMRSVVDQGRVVQVGRHDVLVRSCDLRSDNLLFLGHIVSPFPPQGGARSQLGVRTAPRPPAPFRNPTTFVRLNSD
jgi:hypothetical protein